eukprot:TRINITY_DN12387_c0_g1_i1.p1 TRINITY_DN12387_c0_g1~~TRINITY_DN12387_c0_g1_i1.p1  ORF type:complete len:344 (+),score=41.83 TRINITY_DN12387_c0_g1_i1:56-1087(+)
MRASDVALGLLSAILSALFNGSWAVLSKLECAQVNPLVFMMYASLGVFASSWLVIPIIAPMYHFNPSFSGSPDYEFTYYGMLAGLLFILAIAFTFIAIPLVGISVSQGVWGGTAIVASFLWGVVFFPQQNPIRSMPLTLVALILLIVGTLGIAFKEQLARRLYKTGYEELDESDSPTGIAQRARRYSGLFCCMIVGGLSGSILIPMSFSPTKYQGLVFIPSFGVGAGAAGPAVALSVFLVAYLLSGEWPVWNLRGALVPGFISGVLWNIGNVLSVLGVQSIGYAVAYPVMQCALFVGGLWGLLFREISDRRVIGVFFGSGVVLLTGAALLTVAVGRANTLSAA